MCGSQGWGVLPLGFQAPAETQLSAGLRVEGWAERAARVRAAAFRGFSRVLRGDELRAGSAPPSIGQLPSEERGKEFRSSLRRPGCGSKLNGLHEDLPRRIHARKAREAFHSLRNLPASFFQSNEATKIQVASCYVFSKGKKMFNILTRYIIAIF